MDYDIFIKHNGCVVGTIYKRGGVYSAQIADGMPENGDYPISLFGVKKERELTHEHIENWLKSRVVPPNRDNIKEILEIVGLAYYDYFELLKVNNGQITDDDFSLEIRQCRHLN
ncbi:hypothetical protein FACS1894188_01290 [Clostridia bacterium]|nr:hypothetical protein FACS1894188_01290 [Clostridia bacterium]